MKTNVKNILLSLFVLSFAGIACSDGTGHEVEGNALIIEDDPAGPTFLPEPADINDITQPDVAIINDEEGAAVIADPAITDQVADGAAELVVAEEETTDVALALTEEDLDTPADAATLLVAPDVLLLSNVARRLPTYPTYVTAAISPTYATAVTIAALTIPTTTGMVLTSAIPSSSATVNTVMAAETPSFSGFTTQAVMLAGPQMTWLVSPHSTRISYTEDSRTALAVKASFTANGKVYLLASFSEYYSDYDSQLFIVDPNDYSVSNVESLRSVDIEDIAIYDRWAFLAEEHKIEILDLITMERSDLFQLPRNRGFITSVAVHNGRAYVGTSTGLRIVNLSTARVVKYGDDYVRKVVISNNKAIIQLGSDEYFPYGLRIFDLSTNTFDVTPENIPDRSRPVAVVGNLIYLALQPNHEGLSVWNTRTRRVTSVRGFEDDLIVDITIVDKKAFVMTANDFEIPGVLKILDLTDNSVTQINDIENPYSVTADENRVYVATENDLIMIKKSDLE